ncbi:Tricorn protease domain-containing protein [Vibrio maritimus]
MKLRFTLPLIVVALLSGCNNEAEQQSVETPQPKVSKPLTVEEKIAAKNAQEWEDGRVYITENNFVTYDKDNGKPSYHIYKAKEWQREDLDDEEAYDLPRLVFYWDNGRNVAEDFYDQRQKIWSIKTDGTDLRLVADEFVGMVRLIRMSPNNRYLALAYSTDEGIFKVIKDLKTGDYTELGRSRGYPEFLWAEDSSYLYYVDKFKDWKYILNTGEKKQVATEFNEYSVIYDGKRYVLNEFGAAIYDESKDQFVYGVGINTDDDNLKDYKFQRRGISPTGRYAWGQSRKHRYLIDTFTKTVQSEEIEKGTVGKFTDLSIISARGNFGRREAAARGVLFDLNESQQIEHFIVWEQVGTGRLADGSSLYNAFANNGDFVKGESR